MKSNFLRISNELVEQFAKHNIPGTEMRIVWAIWRKTWCWKDGDRRKDFDWISITQFEEMTGMKRANVHKNIKKLLSKRIITVIQKDNGKLYYGLNKVYSEWVLSKRIMLSKRIQPVIQKDTQVLSKRINTKETITKENIQKKGAPEKRKVFLKSFGECGKVKLTPDEYKKLCQIYGGRYIDKLIQRVEDWKLSKGKGYKNDYAGIRGWINRAKDDGKFSIKWENFREEDFDSKEQYYQITQKYS